MKKIVVFLITILIFSACTKLEDLNKNVTDPTAVAGEALFTGAQKNLFDQMINTNVNNNIFRLFAQYWTETTYTDESNYDLVTRTIPDNHWDILYRDVLKDLDESGKIIKATAYPADASAAGKVNRLACVEILTIYTYSVLVETFGNVPYSKALDINNLAPKYDDGLTIYKDLITRLNTAIASINPGAENLGDADNMYHGDMAQWLKFANSLKLRMALLLADLDAGYAGPLVKDAAANVIASNDDNAKIVYLGAQPNTNPIYNDLVASGRHDFVPTSVIVEAMKTLNDPRMQFYFTQIDTSSTITPALVYLGGEYGASNDFTALSHVANAIQAPTFEGTIFDWSETEFLLAEAAARGFEVTGSAEEHYNTAIRASITYWGGTTADADTYLANPAVAYATATGDYKQKIGTQMWIALYNRGFEAWTEWRKFDWPVLVAPPDALTALPLRYTYPIEEQTLNGANYHAAATAIGGDDVTTKLFWDKN